MQFHVTENMGHRFAGSIARALSKQCHSALKIGARYTMPYAFGDCTIGRGIDRPDMTSLGERVQPLAEVRIDDHPNAILGIRHVPAV